MFTTRKLKKSIIILEYTDFRYDWAVIKPFSSIYLSH